MLVVVCTVVDLSILKSSIFFSLGNKSSFSSSPHPSFFLYFHPATCHAFTKLNTCTAKKEVVRYILQLIARSCYDYVCSSSKHGSFSWYAYVIHKIIKIVMSIRKLIHFRRALHCIFSSLFSERALGTTYAWRGSRASSTSSPRPRTTRTT